MAMTWIQKRDKAGDPVVKPCPIKIAGMQPGQIMLVPTAKLVDEFVRKIPRGKSQDIKTLRERMATAYKAQVCCPITTGFHVRAVAEAAMEELNAGKALGRITPFWRVISPDSATYPKLSFDTAIILQQRAAEGLD